MSESELSRMTAELAEQFARVTGRSSGGADSGPSAAATPPAQASPGQPPPADSRPDGASAGTPAPPPQAPAVHGPRVSVPRSAAMSASTPDRTQAHLDDLVRRFTDRTRSSKLLAERHRPVLADSRATVGFRSSTKEMLYPLAARNARGAGLTDIDGNEYTDITMGFGVLLFGHEPDFLTDAVQRHLADGLRLGPRGPETGEAAELLAGLTGLERVAFASSGTEANASAIRLARAATGRSAIVTFHGAYHGHADATLGRSSGRGADRRTVPISPGIPESAMADLITLDYGAPESLEVIAERAEDIAVVLVEPVQSRNPSLRPVEFVRRLREITSRHGIVLLFDEMLTGLRPHPRGAQELYDVVPDLATYGKLLGGGFPIGAIAGRADLLDAVDGGPWRYGDDSYPQQDTTFFGGTYLQHPLAMTAARAVLTRLRDAGPGLQQSLNDRTAQLATTLNSFFEDEDFPLRMAHWGSMFRFEHRANMELLYHHLVLRGIYVWEWRNFFLSTAHTDSRIEHLTEAVTGSLRELRDAGFFRRRARTPSRSAPSAPPEPTPGADRRAPDMSLYFFGDYPEDTSGAASYDTVIEAARYADQHDFHAVWLPERHFHSFGGIFPNPSVLAAALARETENVRLNAGSVVLPLHDTARVAEEWSVVDNLSGGRVGLGCATGWNSRDFVFYPERFAKRRELLYEQVAEVRTLWEGGALTREGGDGETEIRLYPRPVQERPPMFTAVVSNPDSYVQAARNDLGVVTNLMSQTPDELAENIARYRRTRAEHGLDPDAGRVVVLLHTYLADDHATARKRAYAPLRRYMQSSLQLFGQVVSGSLGRQVDVASLSADDLDAVFDRAYDRYCDQRALIGSPESCLPVIERLRLAGADEVAALVDFGVPTDELLDGLPRLDALRRRLHPSDDGDTGGAPVLPDRTAASPAPGAAPSGGGEAAGGSAGEKHTTGGNGVPRPRTAPGGGPPAKTTGTDAGHPPLEGPLSPGQRRIWMLDQLLPGRAAYNEPAAIGLDGPLDAPALRTALTALVHRHEALRTVIRTTGGEPLQHVRPPGDSELPRLEAVDRQGEGRDAAVRAVMAEEGARPFDLAAGPLFRIQLLKLAEERHVLVLCFHHIVVDAVSAGVLTRDLSALYRAARDGGPDGLPDLPGTYRDFAAGQLSRGPEDPGVAADLAYWTRTLAGELPVLDLPTDRPRPAVASTRGRVLERHLDPELTARLTALSRRHRVTLFMTLLTGYAATLHQLTGETDVIIGSPVSDRPEGTQDLVGFFINTVALRLDLSGDPGFDALLKRTRGTALDAYDHAATPFDTVVRAVAPPRDTARTPVFQVIAEYENGSPFPLDLPGVTAETLAVGADRSLVDLTVYFATGGAEGTVSCRFEYNTDLFDEATVAGFASRLEALLARAADTPEAPLSVLVSPVPAAAEGETHPLPDATVPELFARQAAATPERIAVTSDAGSLTYRQLDRWSARTAAQLPAPEGRDGPAGRDRPEAEVVALWLPRSAELVAGALAVLRSGRAYLPLDPGLGAQRLAAALTASGVRTVLTAAASPALPALPDTVGVVELPSAADAESTSAPSDGAPSPAAGADDLCCVLYTSGSQGRPKGVALAHRGVVNLCQWQHRRFGTGADSRSAMVCSQSFDASLLEIWPALTGGGSVAVAGEEVRLDPRALSRWYAESGVTFSVLPTALATQLLALPADVQPPLKHLVCGGERLLRRPHPEARYELVNVYGPTETTVLVTAQTVPPGLEDDEIPIGRPLDNTRLYILDADGRPVADGGIGELHIAGPGVARGYHRDAERTAAVFSSDPAGGSECVYRTGDRVSLRGDGALLFHGRSDDQVKIRGFRVEPSEATHALLGLTGVRDAAVVPRRGEQGDVFLAGYVVPDRPPVDTDRHLAAVEDELRSRLPEYAVPRTWAVLEALPLTAHGKVDRDALPPGRIPSRDGAGPAQGAPPGRESAPARRLRGLWAEELGGDPVLLADEVSFFELGGDSIKAIRLVNRVSEEFGVDYPVISFFQEPTLQAMAARVYAGTHDPGGAEEGSAPDAAPRVRGSV